MLPIRHLTELFQRVTNRQSIKVEGDAESITQINVGQLTVNAGAIDPTRLPGVIAQQLADLAVPHSGEDSDTESYIDTLITDYRLIGDQGDFDTALSLLGKLLTNPTSALPQHLFRVHFNLGIIQHHAGRYDESVKELRTAHKFLPDDPRAITGLAFAHFLEGDPATALAMTRELIESERAILFTVSVHLHAAAALNTPIDLSNVPRDLFDDPQLLSARLAYQQAVEPDSYAHSVQEALKSAPNDPAVAVAWADLTLSDAKQNQGYLLGQRVSAEFGHNLQRAADILAGEVEKVLNQSPPNGHTLVVLANNAALALRLIGKHQRAAGLLDRVIGKDASLRGGLSLIRSIIYLEDDQDSEVLSLIQGIEASEELRILAAEVRARVNTPAEGLIEINQALEAPLDPELKLKALLVKAGIGLNGNMPAVAEAALDDLKAEFPNSPEYANVAAAYSRRFQVAETTAAATERVTPEAIQVLIGSLAEAHTWPFVDVLRSADELLAWGQAEQASDLLYGRVDLSRESPALRTLCAASAEAGLGRRLHEIVAALSHAVRESTFGLKVAANACVLNGEINQAIPKFRRLYERNRTALGPLLNYAAILYRIRSRGRMIELVRPLADLDMQGSLEQRLEYTKLLTYCGFVDRARSYAYRLFSENRNSSHAWMAVSASVLAVEMPDVGDDDLAKTEIGPDAAFRLRRPDGTIQKFILEPDLSLAAQREVCIPPGHPVSEAALGLKVGETFHWPIGLGGGQAEVVGIQHKYRDAFHEVIERFNEQFPHIRSFLKIEVDPTTEEGIAQLVQVLRDRASFAQEQIDRYVNGTHPLAILAATLGISGIDAMLALGSEGRADMKVVASDFREYLVGLRAAEDAVARGLCVDPLSLHLIISLGLGEIVASVFGPLGVTQSTVEAFNERGQNARAACALGPDGRLRQPGVLAYEGGRVILAEKSPEQVEARARELEGDAKWVLDNCVVLRAVPSKDPPGNIRQLRNYPGGAFLDDVLAADGSGRVLLSEDLHLRQWASEIYGSQGSWLQAILFHLAIHGHIDAARLAECTVRLLELRETGLILHPAMILEFAKIVAVDRARKSQYDRLVSLVGTKEALISSHVDGVVLCLDAMWSSFGLREIREALASELLRALTRFRTEDAGDVLNSVYRAVKSDAVRGYINGWRRGHFL